MLSHDGLAVIKRFLDRASLDTSFVASMLLAYQESGDLDDSGIASALGCDQEGLLRLKLCRLPSPDSPEYARSVVEVARYGGCDAGRLIGILREVEAVTRLSRSVSPNAMMAAARDKKPSKD